jgi:hypothetical protein
MQRDAMKVERLAETDLLQVAREQGIRELSYKINYRISSAGGERRGEPTP